uniref:CSON001719 protein n=1 Tax=Culicoides sonorensis TaxID=179676 RepID=A0A336MJZ8_CULSO
MFGFFKKRPKTPEPSPTEPAPKDDFVVVNNPTSPPAVPTEQSGMYGHNVPYPVLPKPIDGPHGAHLKRHESVSKPTEGVPFKLSSQIIGGDNFADTLKSQIDSIERSINQKSANSQTIGYDFQLEKSVISECS